MVRERARARARARVRARVPRSSSQNTAEGIIKSAIRAHGGLFTDIYGYLRLLRRAVRAVLEDGTHTRSQRV